MNIKTLLLFDMAGELSHEPPKAFTVMKYGKAKYTKGGEVGELDFTLSDAQAVVREFESRGKELVVDYEHQTLSGKEAPAAGWIKALTAEADGLKAEVDWTPRAEGLMRGREYRYFSPVIHQTRRNKILHSVALTNHPALHGIPALVADDLQGAGSSEGVDIQPSENKPKDTTMNQILKSIASKLGAAIPDDMGEDEAGKTILAGLDSLLSKQSGMVAMSDLDTAKAELSELKAKSAVDDARKARKLTPDMESWALAQATKDLQAFNDLIKVMPEVLKSAPEGKAPDASAPDPKAEGIVALTDTDVKIWKTLGLSDKQIESIKKQKKG